MIAGRQNVAAAAAQDVNPFFDFGHQLVFGALHFLDAAMKRQPVTELRL
ncbi:MAG: hypothetical protein IPK16_03350 [Anaerolineales bacterium]|nr:hypothetical protein [Anaerolineales bacterium]